MPTIFVLTGPSAVGKSSTERWLIENHGLGTELDLVGVPSFTSRQKRRGEVDGVDYDFIPANSIINLHLEGKLADCVAVDNQVYGIPTYPIKDALKNGHNVIIVLNNEGLQLVRSLNIGDVFAIFLMPKDLDLIKKRLEKRKTKVLERLNYSISQILNAKVSDSIVLSHNDHHLLRTAVYNQMCWYIERKSTKNFNFNYYVPKLLKQWNKG